MIMPFLSLYIDTLGDFSDDYVQTWAGLIFAATFVTAFLKSGKDGIERKLMELSGFVSL